MLSFRPQAAGRDGGRGRGGMTSTTMTGSAASSAAATVFVVGGGLHDVVVSPPFLPSGDTGWFTTTATVENFVFPSSFLPAFVPAAGDFSPFFDV